MNDYLSKSVVAVGSSSQVDETQAGRTYVMTQDSLPYSKGDMLVATGSGIEKINPIAVEKEHDEKMLELSALGTAVFGIEPNFDTMAKEWYGFAFEYDDSWDWIPHSQLAQTSGVKIAGSVVSYAYPYMSNVYATRYWDKGGRILPEDYRTTGNRKNHLVSIKKLDMSVNEIGNTIVEYQAEISADYQAKVGSPFPSSHIGFNGSPILCSANIENILKVPSYGFQSCSCLQYVRCDKLSSIGGSYTFGGCLSLSVLDFSCKPDNTIPVFAGTVNRVFDECAKNTPLKTLYILVPERLLDSWTNASQWSHDGPNASYLSNVSIVSALPT